eukprot:4190072-Alexandrium_andersonii.AAC.1
MLASRVVRNGARDGEGFRWVGRRGLVLVESSGRPREMGWVAGCRAPRAQLRSCLLIPSCCTACTVCTRGGVAVG